MTGGQGQSHAGGEGRLAIAVLSGGPNVDAEASKNAWCGTSPILQREFH